MHRDVIHPPASRCKVFLFPSLSPDELCADALTCSAMHEHLYSHVVRWQKIFRSARLALTRPIGTNIERGPRILIVPSVKHVSGRCHVHLRAPDRHVSSGEIHIHNGGERESERTNELCESTGVEWTHLRVAPGGNRIHRSTNNQVLLQSEKVFTP